MPKSVLIPIEEYERERQQLQTQAKQEGFREGQQNYLNVLKSIVINESLENCSIMWSGMNPDEKTILNKLIDAFIAKKPIKSTSTPSPKNPPKPIS